MVGIRRRHPFFSRLQQGGQEIRMIQERLSRWELSNTIRCGGYQLI